MANVREKKINYGTKQFFERLNDEQKDAVNLITKKDLTIITGGAGCGKTLVAIYSALQLLGEKQINRIIISRPTVSREEIGFLPGDIAEKMDPWLAPIHENIKIVGGQDTLQNLLDSGTLEIKPFAFMRGQTFLKSAIIVDEAQNVTHAQMEMVLSRLGRSSKMVIVGDIRQKDLPPKEKSGLPFLVSLSKRNIFPELGHQELLINHRHPLVEKLLSQYEKEQLQATKLIAQNINE
jgi:phosphate starvation-inducible PhoH-like protein